MKYWYLYIPAVVCFALPFLYAIFSNRSGKNADEAERRNDAENSGSTNVWVIIRRKPR